jgi:hypothetical protein
MTWARERSEQHRSLQSPEMFFLLTLPFIERAYQRSGFHWSDNPTYGEFRRLRVSIGAKIGIHEGLFYRG